MKITRILKIIIIVMAFINLTAFSCPQERYVLNETKNGTTYLVVVSLDNRENKVAIGNGDFFLTYGTDHISKDNTEGVILRSSYRLHIIPENERFKLEVLLISSAFYKGGKEMGHAEPNGKWEFAGYSDNENGEAAKVLKYFLEHNKSEETKLKTNE